MSATASWQRLANLENNDSIHVLTSKFSAGACLCSSFTPFTLTPNLTSAARTVSVLSHLEADDWRLPDA